MLHVKVEIMANWENKEIILENGEKTVTQAPVIISGRVKKLVRMSLSTRISHKTELLYMVTRLPS